MKYITDISLTTAQTEIPKNALVTASVPLQLGLLNDANTLCLVDASDRQIAFAYRVTQRWQDGSIKWLVLEWSTKSTCDRTLFLHMADTAQDSFADAPRALEKDQQTSVITQTYEASMDATSVQFELVANTRLQARPRLIIGGEAAKLTLLDVTKSEPNSQAVQICVRYAIENKEHLILTWTMVYRSYFSAVEHNLCVHNSQAAQHQGGLWDLGDANSEFIDSLAVAIETDSPQPGLVLEQKVVEPQRALTLTQHSSGGENWQSPVHCIADGSVPIAVKGYELEVDEEVTKGSRATPLVKLNQDFQVCIEKFWQNFPSKIQLSQQSCTIELMASSDYRHELQGGEKKSYTFWLGAGQELANSDVNLRATVPYEHTSRVAPNFLIAGDQERNRDIQALIDQGLQGENNFFVKRELIDEYGWRNFGDLFADHETLGENGKDVSISHYNNQYDPIFGFLSQYLVSGDNRWFELAEDLVKHVKEIDIYDTNGDRDEYNFGLFWHTDHYLDASTCSHRTFSKNHTHAYDGYTSGGGPGGQHCYTAGLTMYYLMTGDETVKATVSKMCQWMNFVFDGSDTLLAKVFGIKKSGVRGYKNYITGQYPLDRGTGHLLVVHLDMFLLTNDQAYLNRAFAIIESTISPFDDIAERDFGNIEGTWFYTVFLQSVSRFLYEKEQAGQFDQDFAFAKRALLHYVDWMVENEQPYLHQIDKLEFANTTWAAQDLRKAYLFYAADYFSGQENKLYRAKGDEFYQYVSAELAADNDADSTRILVLLMQNYLARGFFSGSSKATKALTNYEIKRQSPPNKHWQVIKIISRSLLTISVKRELNWLAFRSAKVAELIGKK